MDIAKRERLRLISIRNGKHFMSITRTACSGHKLMPRTWPESEFTRFAYLARPNRAHLFGLFVQSLSLLRTICGNLIVGSFFHVHLPLEVFSSFDSCTAFGRICYRI
jgi:hypothetical protein